MHYPAIIKGNQLAKKYSQRTEVTCIAVDFDGKPVWQQITRCSQADAFQGHILFLIAQAN